MDLDRYQGNGRMTMIKKNIIILVFVDKHLAHSRRMHITMLISILLKLCCIRYLSVYFP